MKHMDINQRLTIKKMLDEGKSQQKIADALGVHVTSIQRELSRKNDEGVYDPYHAQYLHKEAVKRRNKRNICADPPLAEYIAKLILEEHMNPAQIVASLKEDARGLKIYRILHRR